jgi:DNA-binding transcriptional regulator/RsmH inhibitor MraZ
MLRGNHPARIDDKGRIKVPNGFRTLIGGLRHQRHR